MQIKNSFWILLGILIIAIFLRTYHFTSLPPGLYTDEAWNGNDASEALRTGDFQTFYTNNNGREGLFINIQAFFLKLAVIHEPWVLRLPSAIAGVLTVLGMYFLGRELLGQAPGLLASFFLATSFWHTMFSRIGFRAIMAPLLLVWSLYFLIRAFKDGRTLSSFLFLIFSGVLYGLGFYTYISYRATPVLIVLVLFWFYKEKYFWKTALIFLAAAILVSIPLSTHFLEHPEDFFGRTTSIAVWQSPHPLQDLAWNTLKTIGMFFVVGDLNPRHNLPWRPELFWPVALFFLVGLLHGATTLKRNFFSRAALRSSGHGSRAAARESETETPAKALAGGLSGSARESFSTALLFLWLLVAALPVVVSNEGLPHALRSILLIPPVMLLAAAGALVSYEYLRGRLSHQFLNTALRLFLALLIIEPFAAYFLLWARHPAVPGAFNAEYAELGKMISNLPRSMPVYVVVRNSNFHAVVADPFRPGENRGGVLGNQTTIFLSNTATPELQRAKNVYYILPGEEEKLTRGALVFYTN